MDINSRRARPPYRFSFSFSNTERAINKSAIGKEKEKRKEGGKKERKKENSERKKKRRRI